MTVETAKRIDGHQRPRERTELILSQVDNLPTLPAVAARLLTVTASSRSSVKDVAEVIESDAAITAGMLRMAKCADQGVPGGAMTVAKAVSLLGFNAVRNALLSVQIFRTLPCDEESGVAGFRQRVWCHNVAVACIAQLLAQRAKPSLDSSTAFICGLLHDAGMIALDACMPKSYRRVIDRVERERGHLCTVEREIFGLDHTVAGKRLAIRWQLPLPAAECMWLHHQHPDALPSAVRHPDLIRLIYLADNCVRRQRIGYCDYTPIDDIEASATTIGLGSRDCENALAELPSLMQPYLEFLQLDDGDGPAVYTNTLATANRELGRLNAELLEGARSMAIRSRLIDAVRLVCERAQQPCELADVCLAAGEAVRVFLDLKKVVAFVAQPPQRCIYVAAATDGQTNSRNVVVALDDYQVESALAGLVDAGRAGTASGAPSGLSRLWFHGSGVTNDGPLWAVPFLLTNEIVGGVLIPAQDGEVEPTMPSSPEMGALTDAIAMAIQSKRACIDLERMNEELLDTNRRVYASQSGLVRDRSISMIGEMAAGAAHELNNPLAVISGRAQLLMGNATDEESAAGLKTIGEQAHRASEIVLDLMNFAKPEPPNATLFNLESTLNAICQHCCGRFSLSSDQLPVSLADCDVTVFVDRAHFRTVVEAVLENAVEAASDESLVVKINSRSRASDETVRIVIEDNGAGMSREVLEHAFDPFFSNRPAGRGRGLGLSRAYRLVDINGGKIWLDSVPCTGTTVTIELPARPPS